MLGRYRRRIATASLCTLVTSAASGPTMLQPLMADAAQVVRLASLALQVRSVRTCDCACMRACVGVWV